MDNPISGHRAFRLSRKLNGILIGTVFLALIPPAWSQSITPNADGSQTQVTPRGNQYDITGGTASGQNLFHSFAAFGLTTGEIANFITQPGVVNVLGRVNGGNPSVINGLLQMTGSQANLYLLNPVGVLFGPNAQLNLPGSFTATTADGIGFGNSAFEAVGSNDYEQLVGQPDSLLFRVDQPGAIFNAADLRLGTGETLILAGGAVVNTGTLAAAGGEIMLAAVPGTRRVRLSPGGSILSYEVSAGADLMGLTSLDLPALLTGAGNHYNATVTTESFVQLAQLAIPTAAGTVIVTGQIETANPEGTGGRITLLGDTTGVIDALLTATGQRGGGIIDIGGSYQGKGPLPNAQITYVSADSTLDASAIEQGDGGEIILWSDQSTRAEGELRVRGGSLGGNGGLVETSSLGFLHLPNAPDISAPAGAGGTWLIDPLNLRIEFTTPNNVTGVSPFKPIGPGAILSTSTLQGALGTGGTIIVTTTGTVGSDAGDITLASTLDTVGVPLSGATLIIEATGSIFLNQRIASSSVLGGPLNLQLLADSDNTGNGQVVINGGTAFLPAIDTRGGNLEVRANSTTLAAPDTSGIILGANQTILTDAPPIGRPSGNVWLNGESSNRPGVNLYSGSQISSVGGAIAITGRSNADSGLLLNGIVDAGGGAVVLSGTSNNPAAGRYGIHLDQGTILNAILLAAAGNNSLGTGIHFDQAVAAGAIQLISNADIQVQTLNAPGNITATAANFFRAVGSVATTSVNSIGGSVTIRHGGNGLTPFVVGNASQNGTLGAVVAGADRIDPTQSYLASYSQGNVSILTLAQPNLPGCPSGCAFTPFIRGEANPDAPLFQGGPPLIIDRNIREKIIQKLDLVETEYIQDFANYLGLEGEVFPKPELPKLQENLTLVAEATGIKPAIIYVSFVPPTAETLNLQEQAHHPSAKANVSSELPAEQWLEELSNNRSGHPDDLLELMVVTPEGPPIRKTLTVSQAQIQRLVSQLESEVTNATRLNTRTYLNSARQLYDWLISPLQNELTQANIGNLAFVMAPGLRSLPVAALHDGTNFLVEQYSVGLMPSVSLTDLRYVDVRNTEVLAMGASNFVDQPELPAVPIELRTIAERLWPGDFLINETFTPELLIASRQQKPYGIVHLATHGEFRAGNVNNSYIQFWNQRLGIDQVRALRLNDPPVELMVLSACRTALGDEEAELGFAGLAVQAGVKTALASLWKVDDVGTAGLMSQFYTSLRQEPIKAEALRQAQLAMLKGEIQVKDGRLLWTGGELTLPPELANANSDDFAHPYFWAAFTVIGSPW